MRLARYLILFLTLSLKIQNLHMCRTQKAKNKVEVGAKSSWC